MALVVFMRGVNVGGHKTFRPSQLAKDLAEFDAVNVGTAGTFVIRSSVTQAKLRAEFDKRLPFQAELMLVPARDLIDLAVGEPFHREPPDNDARRFASVLAKRPRTLPRLPISQPLGDQWQVKIVAVSGRFALSLWRRMGRTIVYPNEVVEKKLGVGATTRNWNTIDVIRKIIKNV
jgi:uncharacterized protein (DUF1697 family)